MTTTYSKSKFKAHALEVFRQVEQTKKPVIITHRGQPSLILQPYKQPSDTSVLEKLRGTVSYYDAPLDPVAEDDWDVLA